MGLDAFFTLVPGAGLFQRLHDTFDCVTEVIGDTAGTEKIADTRRIVCRTEGELMEWFFRQHESGRNCGWSSLLPYFVFNNTDTPNGHHCK